MSTGTCENCGKEITNVTTGIHEVRVVCSGEVIRVCTSCKDNGKRKGTCVLVATAKTAKR